MELKLLLDTSSYLRLGNVISPLLKVPFGKEKYVLYILPDLYIELNRSVRLKTDFSWAFEREKIEERKNCRFRFSREQKYLIEKVHKIITKTSVSIQNSASPMDIKCLSYGYVLKITVVTDDKDMLDLAKEFEISTMKTIELLDLMVKCSFRTISDIQNIVKYWIYADDLPKDWREDYKRLFNEDPPYSI